MRAQYDDAGDPLCGSCQPRHSVNSLRPPASRVGSFRPGHPASLHPSVELQRKAERERTITILWAIIAGIFVAAVIVYMGVFWR